MFTHKGTSRYSLPFLLLISVVLALLIPPSYAHADTPVYPGNYSPTSTDWTTNTALPTTGKHGINLSITVSRASNFTVYALCAPTFGAGTSVEVSIGTVTTASTFTYNNTSTCSAQTGNTFISGFRVKESVGGSSGYYSGVSKQDSTSYFTSDPVIASGTNPQTTFNIHLGATSDYGGTSNRAYVIAWSQDTIPVVLAGAGTQTCFFSAPGFGSYGGTASFSVCGSSSGQAKWFGIIEQGLYDNGIGSDHHRPNPQSDPSSYRAIWHLGYTPATTITSVYAYQFNATTGAPVVTSGSCILNDLTLVKVARQVGFTGTALNTSVAVAMAESGGSVNALHYNPSPSDSYDIGLWQVNDDAHPNYDRNRLGTDPNYNGTAAHDIYVAAGNTFSPWVTFTTGAYKKYMTRATNAVNGQTTGDTITSCTDLGGEDVAGDENSNNNCSGWNPLTYFKCALRWAFVPSSGTANQWSTFITNVKTKPPFSFIIDGVGYITGTVNAISGASSCHTGVGADNTYLCNGVLVDVNPGPGENIYNLDFIPEMQKFMTGNSYYSGVPWGPILWKLEILGIWVPTMFWFWNRVGRSFGSKDEEGA